MAPVCSTARTSPVVLHSHKCAGVQHTGISAGLHLSSVIKRRQAAPGVLHVRDYVPHPPPKATAKLSPEHFGRVGQNQLSMDWGQIKSKPQTPRPCWAFLLQHLSWYHCQAQDSTELRPCWELCSSSYCISPSPAVSELPGGTAGATCSGGQPHRRLLSEGSNEFHGLAVLNYESVN